MTTTARMPPPPRGKPYYDVDRGRKMIVPKEGGKAVPYLDAAPPKFSAAKALRRSGMRAATATVGAADRGAARAPRAGLKLGRAVYLGRGPRAIGPGMGSVLIYAFATLIGLALLDNLLNDQGRGPVAYQKILGALGGGIAKLVNPSDPLVPRGNVPATPTSSPAATVPVGALATGAPTSPAGAVTVANPRSVEGLRLVGASRAGTDPVFLDKLVTAAADSGATILEFFSLKRTPATNPGVTNSNHLAGHAADGRAYIAGAGWVPLGRLAALAKHGLRSGDQPGFYKGQPDPNHVDDAYNLRGGT